MKNGIYIYQEDNFMHDNGHIKIKVTNKSKSYVFDLIENTYRYSTAQIDMLFAKSKHVVIRKCKNPHPVRECKESDDWFVIYPHQSGKPFLFELVNEK